MCRIETRWMVYNVSIQENLAQIRKKIHEAIIQCGREKESVKLLAVCKTMGVEEIQEAYTAGQREFAENRVQEWQQKHPALPTDCRWHLIGRLQTNKVKYLNERIALIHSLDRLNLLNTLESQGAAKEIVWPTLVQVNTSRDPNKAGLMEEEVEDFLAEVAKCQHVKVFGFMTIGALDATPQETQEYFRQLRLLKERLLVKSIPNVELKELSMGMSQDFELAIQEGATMIRIGRQIFGERD